MKKYIKASFFQKIVLPAMLAIVLFMASVFAFIIPAFESNAIEQKRNMLHELTNTAWSILQKYHLDEQKGLLTLQEAQQKAIAEVEALRYGADKKDYFWITDLEPAMIMHPYVHELTGQSLHDYADPDGKKLFIEALKIAQDEGEGFISYKWQRRDDSSLIVPKLSFVKAFPAWDWIIGTGIYLDDIQKEISSLTNKLLLILLGITVFISFIIFFITYQSLHIENRRRLAEEQLHESREKYRSLIESSTEGVMLLLNSKISYSNAYIQKWLQYTAKELEQKPVNQLFAEDHGIDLEHIKDESKHEVKLLCKDGSQTEAVLTIMPVQFAGKEGVLFSLRDTHEHRAVKTELQDYRQRFQQIMENSSIGVFRFSLKGKRLLEFNRNAVELLGYRDESEMKKVPLANILESKAVLRELLAELRQKGSIISKQINLRKKGNDLIACKLSLFIAENMEDGQLFCDGLLEAIDRAVIPPEELSPLLNQLHAFFAQGQEDVRLFGGPPITCPADASISEAAKLMAQHKSDYVLLTTNQKPIGILTYKDIAHRCLPQDIPLEAMASQIMTAPVIFADQHEPLVKAFSLMEKNQIAHLALRNENGETVAVLERSKLSGLFLNPSQLLQEAIGAESSPTEMMRLRQTVPALVKPLLFDMGGVGQANKIVSGFNDAITSQIIKIAIRELGPPPVPFAFIVIGSAGREELAFNSDQDNALIFADDDNIPLEELQSYFQAMGTKICNQLGQSGLHLCPGNYMASNPKWCQPLHVWKDYFTEWIVNAEPENILHISVFFDLRLAYGEEALFKELEDHIFDAMKGRSAFFYFLAQSVSSFKPPLNVFGNIVTETSPRKNEIIDVKNCIATVVMFVRIYALYNNIRHKGTMERLKSLRAAKVLNYATADEVAFHFDFLVQQRLRRQLEQISQKMEITNAILPKKMTEMEQIILKKVFSQMSAYQEKLGAAFMSAFKG